MNDKFFSFNFSLSVWLRCPNANICDIFLIFFCKDKNSKLKKALIIYEKSLFYGNYIAGGLKLWGRGVVIRHIMTQQKME
jgi:hypothetical protein